MTDNPNSVAQERRERHNGQLGRHTRPPRERHFAAGSALHAGSSFSIHLDELEAALSKLASTAQEFERRATGGRLPERIATGTGPVADAMGHRFNHRLGEQGGMHHAVKSMIAQLNVLLGALSDTAVQYDQAEQINASLMAAVHDDQQDGPA